MTEFLELVMDSEVARTSVVAILGGIGFKVVERFLNSKQFVEEHTTFRKELREELNSVREEVTSLREEVDEWRNKYYHQLEISTELREEIGTLRAEIHEYKTKVDMIQNDEPDTLGR